MERLCGHFIMVQYKITIRLMWGVGDKNEKDDIFDNGFVYANWC